jgi:hypothetical protein
VEEPQRVVRETLAFRRDLVSIAIARLRAPHAKARKREHRARFRLGRRPLLDSLGVNGGERPIQQRIQRAPLHPPPVASQSQRAAGVDHPLVVEQVQLAPVFPAVGDVDIPGVERRATRFSESRDASGSMGPSASMSFARTRDCCPVGFRLVRLGNSELGQIARRDSSG